MAALLLALMIGTFAAPVTCLGWEASAAERRACCQRAHHQHCNDQASADSCCAAQDQGCHAPSTAASQAAAAAFGAAAVLPVGIWNSDGGTPFLIARYTTVAVKHLHGPPLLLAPPLRI